MPARSSQKCRQCSKLSLEQALQKHGESGDRCWQGEVCHKRRTYYRHRERYNKSRRHKYAGEQESAAQLKDLEVPAVPVAIVYFYRTTKTEPLHALGVALQIGSNRKGTPKLTHTMGWTEVEVKSFIQQAIADFSQQYEVSIRGVVATVELDPQSCPLQPCPLQLDPFGHETSEAEV